MTHSAVLHGVPERFVGPHFVVTHSAALHGVPERFVGLHFAVVHCIEVHFVVAETSLAASAMTDCQPDEAVTAEYDAVGCS